MKNILVALGIDDGDERLIEKAAMLAQGFEAKVWLLHVAAPDPDFVGFDTGPAYIRKTLADDLRVEHKALQKYAQSLKAANITTESLLVQGPTVETIFHEAEKLSCDLLILGAHKHGFLRRIFGEDVPHLVVERSTIPILIVPIRAT
jgi:nucleotide-binding universal stress UspA family protein